MGVFKRVLSYISFPAFLLFISKEWVSHTIISRIFEQFNKIPKNVPENMNANYILYVLLIVSLIPIFLDIKKYGWPFTKKNNQEYLKKRNDCINNIVYEWYDALDRKRTNWIYNKKDAKIFIDKSAQSLEYIFVNFKIENPELRHILKVMQNDIAFLVDQLQYVVTPNPSGIKINLPNEINKPKISIQDYQKMWNEELNKFKKNKEKVEKYLNNL